jgi:hypothetical protein
VARATTRIAESFRSIRFFSINAPGCVELSI